MKLGSAKISIITPVFNGEETIKNCIESVASQSYLNFEHLVVDGCSSDDTIPILEQAKSTCPNLRFVSEKDNGIYDAMNKGLTYANGDWIYFLGCDDILADNDVLKDLFDREDTATADIVYGGVEMNNSKMLFFFEFDKARLSWMNMSHQGLFVNKRVFKEVGNFNLKYNALADYEFNLRWFGNENFKKVFIKRKVAIYNESGFSSEFYDKVFYDEKLRLVKKYLGFSDQDAAFQDTIFRTAKIQIRNNDVRKGFGNMFKLFLLRKKLYYLKFGIIEVFKRLAINFNLKPSKKTVK